MTIAPLFLALIASSGVAGGEAPTILDFTASWCGPCQQMRPVVDQLVQKRYPIKAVDFDTSKALAKRYNVDQIPTFVAVAPDGRELGRLVGYCPAGDLVGLYRSAKTKLDADDGDRDETPQARAASEEEPAPRNDTPRKNPLPWETVVRIKITNQGMMEFGSGTVIYSTPEESIILTCAHIFKVGERRPKGSPSQFALPIEVHLFDGQLHGTRPAVVHLKEVVRGEAIDYDFNGDVGLIRIRPGHRLPASPVVPVDWVPKSRTQMTTVGCSEGHDATAWSTWITKPLVRGMLADNPSYEAIECAYAPKQGRSGGGLYTLDGKLAGVCDFAEPTDGHGLYASPRTIRKFLDKNQLAVCYAPNAAPPRDRPGAMVAQGKGPTKVRAQSSSEAEPRPKKLTIPPPSQLNIADIGGDDAEAGRPAERRGDSPWAPEGGKVVASRGAIGARGRSQDQPPAPSRDDLAQATDDEAGPRPAEMKLRPGTEPDPNDAIAEARPPQRPADRPKAPAPQVRSSKSWRAAGPQQAEAGNDRVNR